MNDIDSFRDKYLETLAENEISVVLSYRMGCVGAWSIAAECLFVCAAVQNLKDFLSPTNS